MGGGGTTAAGKGPAPLPLERFIITGGGTNANPAGTNAKLEKNKNVGKRNETIQTKAGTELVFRTYSPKTKKSFDQMASNPDLAAVRTSTGNITFMEKGAARFYLASSKGDRTSISNPIWRDGQMAIGKKADSSYARASVRLADVEESGVQKRAGRAVPAVDRLTQKGHLVAVSLPGGGRGYRVKAKGSEGEKAWKVLHEAGYSFRQKIAGQETWMTESTWKRLQRH